jgi:hypothetical protein
MTPAVEAEEARAAAGGEASGDCTAAGAEAPRVDGGAAPEAGVIDAARRRQRRRRGGVAVLVVAAGVGVAIVAAGGRGPNRRPRPAAPHAVVVAADTVVARTYMGVSCHRANWIGCDRVGLAVWLKRPARMVSATIAGRPLRLDDKAWSVRRERMYAGFLQPAGLRRRLHVRADADDTWGGSPTPTPVVTLRVVYPSGGAVTTRLRVPLMAGWG